MYILHFQSKYFFTFSLCTVCYIFMQYFYAHFHDPIRRFKRPRNVSLLARETVPTVFQSDVAIVFRPQHLPSSAVHRRKAQ